MGSFVDAMHAGATPLRQVALSVLCAYLMSHAIAALYAWTRRGQEYSRNFVQALVISGIVGAMLMLAIGNSLPRGVGIVGALSLIRFRTTLRDPLDMVFIFASFAAGIAAGAGNVETGMVGTAIFLAVVFVMRFAGMGSGQIEAELRVRLAGDVDSEGAVRALLAERTVGFALLKRRASASPARDKDKGRVDKGGEKASEATDDARRDRLEPKQEQRLEYRVVIRGPDDEPALVRALSLLPGVLEVGMRLDAVTTSGPGGDDD